MSEQGGCDDDVDGQRSDYVDGQFDYRNLFDGGKLAAGTELGTELPSINNHGGNNAAAGTRTTLLPVNKRRLLPVKKQKKLPSVLIILMVTAAHIVTVVELVEGGYVTVDVITDEFDHTPRRQVEAFRKLHAIAREALPLLEVQGHRYLGAMDSQPIDFGGDGSGPARLIKIPFKGEREEDRAQIALTDHDLYLVAFENNIGTWHCFKGYEHLIPNCVVLNPGPDADGKTWNQDYGKLIDKGYEMLHTVPLGRQSDLEATHRLALYRHLVSSLPALKDALVRKIIMYPEALRIRPIRETFSGVKWDEVTYITQEDAMLTQCWGAASYWFWRWHRNGGEFLKKKWEKKRGPKCGINNEQDADEKYDLMRRPGILRIDRSK